MVGNVGASVGFIEHLQGNYWQVRAAGRLATSKQDAQIGAKLDDDADHVLKVGLEMASSGRGFNAGCRCVIEYQI